MYGSPNNSSTGKLDVYILLHISDTEEDLSHDRFFHFFCGYVYVSKYNDNVMIQATPPVYSARAYVYFDIDKYMDVKIEPK